MNASSIIQYASVRSSIPSIRLLGNWAMELTPRHGCVVIWGKAINLRLRSWEQVGVLTPFREHRYATLKISTYLRRAPSWTRREVAIYKHLSETSSLHPGQSYIRELWDTFEVVGPHGNHPCLIQPPMHMSVLDMIESNPGPLTAPLLRIVLKHLLTALDFLHTDAEIIHTGMTIVYMTHSKLHH